MPRFSDDDYIFDGFAHRKFNPKYDGWMNEMPSPEDYPCVASAESTLALFNELCAAKRKIWQLERRLGIRE